MLRSVGIIILLVEFSKYLENKFYNIRTESTEQNPSAASDTQEGGHRRVQLAYLKGRQLDNNYD